MQLKSLAKSTEVLNKVTSVLNNTELSHLATKQALEDIGKSYTTETLKEAIALSTLDKEQIKVILSANGLQGELLETTADELANAASTNAVATSQAATTGTTGGLSAAFKGLGVSIKSTLVSIKSFALANPALTISAIATAAIAGGVAIYSKLHPSLIQASKDLKEQKQAFDDVAKEVTDLSDELETANNRMSELQSKGTLSLVESQELAKLKETTAELETQLAIKKEEQRLEAKKTADIADKAFNGSFRSKYDDNGELIHGDAAHSNDAIKELENSIKAYYNLQNKYNEAKKNADFYARETEKNGGRYSATGKVDWREYEKYVKQLESLETQMNHASIQAQTMYEAINGQKEAYEGLSEAGYTLNQEQLNEYQTVRKSSDAYRDFCADINDTAKSFSELDNAQKRSSLEAEFVLKGLDGESAKNIVASIDDEDLNIAATLTAQFDSSSTVESVRKAIEDATSEAQDIADDTPITFSSQLTSSEDSLDKFKESISSASEAYSKLLSGDYSSSELLDCIQAINKAVSDMDGSLNWEYIAGQSQMESLELLGDAIEHISQKYADSILADAGIDINSGFGQMLSGMIQQIHDTEAAFDSMNSHIDSLQSSYQTLTSILQSYNETGYINLDNLQALLTADSNLIAMLQVENGQLVINQSAYENLVAVQLLEFKAKLDDAAAAEIEALAKSKAEEATNRNADASDTAVTKLDAETAAFNRNTSAAISNAVAKAEESGVPTEDIQGILDKYNKVWEAAQNNYKTDFPSFAGVASDAKTAAKETKKEVDVMAELNSEMDKLQSAFESLCDIRDTYNKYGKITVDQYQELTDMGFNFLANLVDENGELGLNASAFERLSHAKMQELQIQMARNAVDTINGLKTETEAVEYLTYANENLRDAALGAAEAMMEEARIAAWKRGEQQGLAADQIVQGYEASRMLASKVDFTFKPDDEKKETKEKEKEDKTDELLDAYNSEKKLLEHLLAMDQISRQEYYDRLMSLVYRYFDGDEEHKDQIWDVEESYHDYLESIKETYNWIEIFLNALAKKTSALIDKAEKFISWSKKNAMINRAVKATDREIQSQTTAYAYYAEQARKVKLPNEYINKIQNGTLTMEDMQNEKLSGKIEKYQEWYDKMTECQDAVSSLYDQERDLIKQKLDNVLDYYDNLDSYMSSIVSKMDSFISLMDDMGKRSSLTDLLEQFAAANEQLSHFQSKSENIQIEKEDTRFDSSKKVAEAKERDKQEDIDELNRQKEALTSVQDTGTYKKLLKEIEKAEAAYDKQYEKLWAIDPEKDPDGKKWCYS